MESLRLTTVFVATPKTIYEAWISGEGHGAMTGASATSDPRAGGAFTARDGYISGKHLELEPGKRLLQAWRTTEFPATAPDSRVEVKFARSAEGTRLTLLQSGIPDGQGEMYAHSWQEHYFGPMRLFFESKAGTPGSKKKTKPAPKEAKPAPKKAKPAPKRAKARAGARKPPRKPAERAGKRVKKKARRK